MRTAQLQPSVLIVLLVLCTFVCQQSAWAESGPSLMRTTEPSIASQKVLLSNPRNSAAAPWAARKMLQMDTRPYDCSSAGCAAGPACDMSLSLYSFCCDVDLTKCNFVMGAQPEVYCMAPRTVTCCAAASCLQA